MQAAYVIDSIRTPIGRFGGALAPVRSDDLCIGVGQGIAMLFERP